MKTIKAAMLMTLLVSPNVGHAERWSDPTHVKGADKIRSAELNYSSCIDRAIRSHNFSMSDDVETEANIILKQCDGDLASVKRVAEAASMTTPSSDRLNHMNRDQGELKVLRAFYYERAKQTKIIK